MKRKRTQIETGFTLIELMIVVVIIGVLSMIAYPAYTRYLVESRRSDAYNALSQLANDLEKFYSDCSAYTENLTAGTRDCKSPTNLNSVGSLGRGASGAQSPNGYYTLKVGVTTAAGAPAGGYLLTASPNAGGPQVQDTTCKTITLDSTGAKKAKNSGGTDTSNVCWKK